MEKEIADFIEVYYPNYTRCDLIATLEDLHKLVNEEFDDTTDEVLARDYGGDYAMAYPRILRDYQDTLLQVLEISVKNHQKSLVD
jgi:hypothetical protein